MCNRLKTNETENKIFSSLKSISISGFVDTRDKVNAYCFESVRIFVTIRGKSNQETAKVGIRTPLKLYVYFWFVS